MEAQLLPWILSAGVLLFFLVVATRLLGFVLKMAILTFGALLLLSFVKAKAPEFCSAKSARVPAWFAKALCP